MHETLSNAINQDDLAEIIRWWSFFGSERFSAVLGSVRERKTFVRLLLVLP